MGFNLRASQSGWKNILGIGIGIGIAIAIGHRELKADCDPDADPDAECFWGGKQSLTSKTRHLRD